jgi:hypothetical protein
MRALTQGPATWAISLTGAVTACVSCQLTAFALDLRATHGRLSKVDKCFQKTGICVTFFPFAE